MKQSYNNYLFFITLLSLSIKWILAVIEFGFNLDAFLLFNLEDTQYFPIVYSLSDFNISPSFLEDINSDKVIGFPILGIIIPNIGNPITLSGFISSKKLGEILKSDNE